MRAGAWNLRVGRNVGQVVAEVQGLLDTWDLDWLACSEGFMYRRALAKGLKGYKVVGSRVDNSARDSFLIVRKSFKVKWRLLHRLERVGWERDHGRRHLGLHWPRSANSVVLEEMRVMPIHLPPGPDSWKLRHQARITSLKTVLRLGRRWNTKPRPWLIPGDWNYRPGDEEIERLAEQLDATITGDGIDWVLASKGMRVTNYQRLPYGNSDHKPVIFRVRSVRSRA